MINDSASRDVRMESVDARHLLHDRRDAGSPRATGAEAIRLVARDAARVIGNPGSPRGARDAAVTAETANRAKDEFLAMLSHEMRSPLASIAIWASLLRTGLAGERTAHAIASIERNVAILSRFIEELMDVSRIVSGKLALDIQTVDPAAVVGAALDTVRASADAKGILLETLIDPSGRVAGDATRLQQVVSNLLTNAVKFSACGGRVLLRVATEGSHAVISVRDVGEGIPADCLPYIFERYRQANEAGARVHGGLGLGLAIVREIVALHHGSIEAESAGAGQGATFTVRLPFLGSPDALHLDQVVANAGGPGARTSTGVRVCLEDDAKVPTPASRDRRSRR
jgi:signal transduction histidine kinase